MDTPNEPFGMRPAVRPVSQGGPVTPQEVCRLLKRTDNWILTGSAVFRRDAVMRAGGFDRRLGSFADGVMARKIALSCGFYYATQVVATWVVYSDSVSRRTALDPVAGASCARNRAGPDRGGSRVSRLVSPYVPEPLAVCHVAVGAGGRPDRLSPAGIDGCSQCGWTVSSSPACARCCHAQLARLTALGWLWFRLRPTTLIGLLRTALAFRLKHFRATSAAATMSVAS